MNYEIEVKALIDEAIQLGITIIWYDTNFDGTQGGYTPITRRIHIAVQEPAVVIYRILKEYVEKVRDIYGSDTFGKQMKAYYNNRKG